MAAALSSRAGTTAGAGGGVGSAGASGSSGGVAVIERLAQLQNLIKRDPEGYADEFRLQHRAFAAELAIFQLNPRSNPEAFKALVTFLAHVAPCYRAELAGFPGQLFGLLGDRADALAGDVRRTLVTALILLRNRGLLEPLPLFAALTPLFRVKDKFLRDLVSTHIVADVKAHATKSSHGGGGGAGAGSTGGASTKGLQAHLFSLVGDEHAGTAKRGLDILIELYRRRVWTDARTVNVIAGALTSERAKLLVTALKFFLGPGSGDANANAGGESDSDGGGDDDDDDDEEGGGTGKTPYSLSNVSAKELRAARNMHQHAKSTRKRERQIARRVTALKKARSKDGGTAAPSFPAVQLLHDPQGLAERMFASLRGGKQRFEVRLLQMNLVSRLIGTHRLLLLPFYSYCQKYLAAHQAAVTQVLVCLIQACHELVPPDEVMPVLTTIANAFVSDRSSPEAIQVGLNAMRSVIAAVPTVLEEPAMRDLMPDLLAYRKFRSKGVVSSARSLLNLVRESYPGLLKRKDWGRDVATGAGGASAAARPSSYGATSVATAAVEGAGLLGLLVARVADARRAAALEGGGSDDDEEGGGAGKKRRRPSSSAKKGGKRGGKKAAADGSDGEGSDAGGDDDLGSDASSVLSDALSELVEELTGKGAGKGGRGGASSSAASAAGGDEDDEEGDEEEEDDDDGSSGPFSSEGDEAPELVPAGAGDSDDDEEDEDVDDDEEGDDSDDDEEGEEDGGDDEEEMADADGSDGSEGSDDDDDDDEEEEEAAAAAPRVSRKRARPSEEGADAGGDATGSVASRPTAITSATAASAMYDPSARLLSARDFNRLRRLRRKLVDRGLSLHAVEAAALAAAFGVDAGSAGGVDLGAGVGVTGAPASSPSSAAEPARKKRRRGARPGTLAEEAAEAEAEAQAEAEAAGAGLGATSGGRAGATFAAPVIVVDEAGLEAVETRRKRRAARRVADVLEERKAKFEGKRPGGGLTNKEKSRFKAFQMLRKSASVQAKAKQSLVASQRAVRRRLAGNAVMDKRKKQRRRRT